MSRELFFNKKSEFLTIAQILEITGSSVADNVDRNQKIFGVGTLDKASTKEISFVNSGSYLEKLYTSHAGFCFVDEKNLPKVPPSIVAITHKNPYYAYAKTAESFYAEKPVEFSDSKLIHPTAQIGAGARIAPNAYVGKNVRIGKNSFIGPNASIMDNCVIGDDCTINAGVIISYAVIGNKCIIHNGAAIGQDGFGFAHNLGINHKIIQLGIVEIGNSVEIGANACIDRGAIENTTIGDDVKIDNLVQIAHNVVIGQGTVIAGCTAVAGSSRVGKFVQIGGNASISGHIEIGDGAKIAGMSGVLRDIPPMQTVAGIPSLPIKKWHRLNTMMAKMIESNNSNES